MIFVDSGAFIALWLTQDGKHAEASAAWDRLEADRERLVSSNFILDEVMTYLGRRAGARFAAEHGRNILDSRQMTMLRPDVDDERAALALLEKHADQGVGFTDAVSFALMRRHKIQRAFSYDEHFARAGFSLWPRV